MANRAYVDGEDGGFSCDGAVMAVVRVLHIDLPTYLLTRRSFQHGGMTIRISLFRYLYGNWERGDGLWKGDRGREETLGWTYSICQA